MKKLLALIPFMPLLATAQTPAKIANEAFVVTRMIAKFHVDPRPVDDAFSEDVFNQLFWTLDKENVFFTQEDIDKLLPYSTLIDDEIKKQNTEFLNQLTVIFQSRLNQADSMGTVICAKPFNLTSPEKYTASEDTLNPANTAAMQQKLYKVLKFNVLNAIVDGMPASFKSFTPAKQKLYTDSAEAACRKKVLLSFKRKINNILQNPYGMVLYMGNIYCETIAQCFDPHTEYMPKTEKENFESELGQKAFRFGFSIEEDENGGVLISKLEPGTPAFKCGKLNKGDKFTKVQWAGRQAIDVSESSTSEFSSLIGQSNHDTIYFTVRKADGAIVQVPLLKAQQEEADPNGDDGRVKSFILNGSTCKVGYIYLPAFYEDWENSDYASTGCANDVSKEIVKLRKDSITGLIIDLRYNGGGSADEARQLAGIFIDVGPVAQEKGKDPKPYTLKDVDRGTIYDGPLALMVNGYSASASELLAGTLQDYHRAVIIGTPTYGKATAQVVFPMDTTVTYETLGKKQTENYIKITIERLYRVTGNTAQFTGVVPDLVLPDVLDAEISREADDEFALKPTKIEANKFFQPYAPLPIAAINAAVKPQVDTSTYFNEVKTIVTGVQQKNEPKDVMLTLSSFINNGDNADIYATLKSKRLPSKNFTVQNNQYELTLLQSNSYLNQLNDGFKQIISTDPYVNVAYEVLNNMKK